MTDDVMLIWGDHPFLVREAALEALGPGHPRILDAADWRSSAVADLATPSLFGEERSLLITGAQDLPDDALAEVGRHAADPPPNTRLALAAVVTARAKAPPRKLAGALGKRAAVRHVSIERRELPNWVRERARRYGLRPSGPGAVALVETVGEDPAILDQALRQIAAVAPPDGLTPEAVRAQFRGFGEGRIWELCDAAFTGDTAGALRSLSAMLEAREEPLMVLGGIAARLRELIRVRALPAGIPLAEVARAAGLRFDWQARRYVAQARRYEEEGLARLHGDIVEADRTLKQGGAGDVVLAILVARIGEAGAPATGDRMRIRRTER